jgi:thiosulfate/3-mercaptopyruvate sulfurtransferase
MYKLLILSALFTTSAAFAIDPGLEAWRYHAAAEATLHPHAVTTAELKEWMDQGKPLVILDARAKVDDDGYRLPTAFGLPYNSPDIEIKDAVPGKDSMVVVYCESANCPASQLLFDRLDAMGYAHVYRYREGLRAWIAAGYPIDRVK